MPRMTSRRTCRSPAGISPHGLAQTFLQTLSFFFLVKQALPGSPLSSFCQRGAPAFPSSYTLLFPQTPSKARVSRRATLSLPACPLFTSRRFPMDSTWHVGRPVCSRIHLWHFALIARPCPGMKFHLDHERFPFTRSRYTLPETCATVWGSDCGVRAAGLLGRHRLCCCRSPSPTCLCPPPDWHDTFFLRRHQ